MDVQWTPPRAKADPNIRIAYMSDDVRMADDTGRVLCKRFELLAILGAGATAAVYRALDRETKSEVAIKILYKSLRGDAEALRYFAQEGRLAARIVHPHLLRAHYYGQRNGTPFIVFELVPGASLTQVAALRPMPWRRLGTIVMQVLDALAKLHEECVLHGDIQPENIIVQQTTLGQDFAKVIDLGFASARGCSRLTLAPEPASEIHGTPGFIAPERLAGLEPDARADIYSVGALMYFLLTTRQVPDISLAPDELGIPAPSIMAPGARIPRAIDAIVMRALSDVDDRFPNAAAMAGALRDALAQPEHAPAVAVLPTTPAPVDDPAPVVSDDKSTIQLETPEPDAALDPPPATPVSAAIQDDAGADTDEHDPSDPPLGAVLSAPWRTPARAQLVVGVFTALVLCIATLATLWRMSAAQGGSPIAAEAMNTAPPDEINTAAIHRPTPAAPSASLPLPQPPPEPDYTPVTRPRATKKAGDERVSRMRTQIRRCKPLLPFSKSTVTVEPDRDGQTRIHFSKHKARGDFGRCIARVAAQTKLARDERLAFKM